MSEYYQQMMRTDRSFIGLHYGKNHERVSGFCRALRDDNQKNPDGVSVSIRWDDRNGYWVIASSRKEIVTLVIEWFKQSELEFFTQRLERASVQPMMILEAKSEDELEEIRARRKEGRDDRVGQGRYQGRNQGREQGRYQGRDEGRYQGRDDRANRENDHVESPPPHLDEHQSRQSSQKHGFQRPKRHTNN